VSGAAINITDQTLGVNDKRISLPLKYSLRQNFPNPFNPTTEIAFSLPTASKVTISIYNILGQLVTTLKTGEYAAGSYSETWNGLDAKGQAVGSGVYFYKMSAVALDNTGIFSSVRKMMLMK
jgi:hypothetical protein